MSHSSAYSFNWLEIFQFFSIKNHWFVRIESFCGFIVMPGRVLREREELLSSVYQVPHQLTCVTQWLLPSQSSVSVYSQQPACWEVGLLLQSGSEALGKLGNILNSRNTYIFPLWDHGSVSETTKCGILLVNEVRSCLSLWFTMMTFNEAASEGCLFSSPVLGTYMEFCNCPSLWGIY